MKQLTLRGFDPELSLRLEKLARERSLSLNRAALLLMRRGAGLETPPDLDSPRGRVGSSLDRFIGVWSEKEEEDFLESIRPFDRVDPELWE